MPDPKTSSRRLELKILHHIGVDVIPATLSLVHVPDGPCCLELAGDFYRESDRVVMEAHLAAVMRERTRGAFHVSISPSPSSEGSPIVNPMDLGATLCAAMMEVSGLLHEDWIGVSVVGGVNLSGKVVAQSGGVALASFSASWLGALRVAAPRWQAPLISAIMPSKSHAVSIDSIDDLTRPGPPHPENPGTSAVLPVDLGEGPVLKIDPRLHRALELSAIGRHNVLVIAPRDVSIGLQLGEELARLMGPMPEDLAIQVAIHRSLCGLLNPQREELPRRPVRSVSATISRDRLVGGVIRDRIHIGAMTDAHGGVLVMEDLQDFQTPAIKAVRRCTMRGLSPVNFAEHSRFLPTNALILATAWPCPCGWSGSAAGSSCACEPRARCLYQDRLRDLAENIDAQIVVATDSSVQKSDIYRSGKTAREWQEKNLRLMRLQLGGYKHEESFERDGLTPEYSGFRFSGDRSIVERSTRITIEGRSALKVAQTAQAALTGEFCVGVEGITAALEFTWSAAMARVNEASQR